MINDVALRSFSLAIEKAYGNWGYLIARSFVSGVFIALGATVGLAILVAIIGAILQQMEVIPVVGDFFTRINEFLESAGFGQ